jgi:DNA replication protein DnaC
MAGKIAALEKDNLETQARRAELLVENGLPMDYLDDLYSCPKCRDTGNGPAGPCECLDRLYNQELTKELGVLLQTGSEQFEQFDLSYYDESARPQMARVLEICRSFAEGFAPGAPNLLLQGETGLGKTFLSACIARSVSGQGFSVVYDTAINVFSRFEAAHFTRDEESQVYKRRYLRCDLLILDDLGSEMTTPFVQSSLYELVNERLLNHKSTVVSTNLSPEELSQRYNLQSVSRLLGEYQLLQFRGPDIRRKKREG